MTEIELMNATQAQLAKLADLIEGKAWGVAQGKPRIYLPTCKGRKLYFDFPDYPDGTETVLGGAAFHVYVDDCGQHPNWYASQREAAVRNHYRHALALEAAFHGEWELAREIFARDEEYTAAEIDTASGHFANGRIDEAWAALGLESVIIDA